jgi:archaeal preflagellin peptidase FlaK
VQELDLLRVVIAFSFLIYASVSDWRTRRVSNVIWMDLGIIALIILWMDMFQAGAPLIAQSILLPIAFLFADIFWEREKGLKSLAGILSAALYILSFAWIAFIGYSVQAGTAQWSDVSAPFVAFFIVVIFEVFYMFDVIKGGADAKAGICLAILFPTYPQMLSGIPIITPSAEAMLTFFPVALSALFMGAIVSLTVPIYFLFKNMGKGEKVELRSLLSFDLPIDEVEKHPVWLVEWVDGGQVRSNYRKVRESETLKDDLAALRGIGREEVRVTYKIPFIIPLTVGLMEVLVIGNILFLVY